MAKSDKPEQPETGCKFCTDPDFAFRHTLEDDALMRIAEIAVDILAEGAIINMANSKRLREAVEFFQGLDTIEAQMKRAAESLQEISSDLGP